VEAGREMVMEAAVRAGEMAMVAEETASEDTVEGC